MGRIAGRMVASFEGALPQPADAVAADTGIAARDALLALRARLAAAEAEAAVLEPECVSGQRLSLKALPITSAGRFSPLRPWGILSPFNIYAAVFRLKFRDNFSNRHLHNNPISAAQNKERVIFLQRDTGDANFFVSPMFRKAHNG